MHHRSQTNKCNLLLEKRLRSCESHALGSQPYPQPKKRSPLIFAGSNPQIPLHFFEFHFPSQIISPISFRSGSSRENRPEKILWRAPNSGERKCPNRGDSPRTQPRRQLPHVRNWGPGTHSRPNSRREGAGEAREGREGEGQKCMCVCVLEATKLQQCRSINTFLAAVLFPKRTVFSTGIFEGIFPEHFHRLATSYLTVFAKMSPLYIWAISMPSLWGLCDCKNILKLFLLNLK